MVVLGIDVGLRTTGYVVCEVKGLEIKLLEDEQITPKVSLPLPRRLSAIFEKLAGVIEKTSPKILVLEQLYSHHKHPVTLGSLAQVRGVVALLASRYDLEFYEYSPTRAKKAISGTGKATASQVKRMVENFLNRRMKSQHTADAFSLIVAFSHEQKLKNIYD
ncbi:MAG: crossover junction endodeoxyribonuclease RuvC [Candidatus Omnitrophica bacterium]|nr:crossover junction endodeoxyribonuclease RuvC [Candidatus Omnitrophota bacterium]